MNQEAKMSKKKGQALVEFALVLPLLLLLLVGLVEFGLLMFSKIVVTNAAWEGANAGATIVDPAQGDAEIIGAVQQAAYGLDPALLVIDIDPGQDEPPRDQPWPAPRGSQLTVTVSYTFTLTIPSMTVPVSARAVTRMEYQNPP